MKESGNFDLRFRSSPLPDPNFRKDLEKWAKKVGTGWAKRTGAVAGDCVSLHFLNLKSAKADGFYRGTFKKGQNQ